MTDRINRAMAHAREHGTSIAEALAALAVADGDQRALTVQEHAQRHKLTFHEAMADMAGESPRARAEREQQAQAADAWAAAVRRHVAAHPHLAGHPNGRAIAALELGQRITEQRQAAATPGTSARTLAAAPPSASEIEAATRGTWVSAPAVPPLPAAAEPLDLLRERLRWGRR